MQSISDPDPQTTPTKKSSTTPTTTTLTDTTTLTMTPTKIADTPIVNYDKLLFDLDDIDEDNGDDIFEIELNGKTTLAALR